MDEKEVAEGLDKLQEAALWNATNGDPETAKKLAVVHNVVSKGQEKNQK